MYACVCVCVCEQQAAAVESSSLAHQAQNIFPLKSPSSLYPILFISSTGKKKKKKSIPDLISYGEINLKCLLVLCEKYVT